MKNEMVAVPNQLLHVQQLSTAYNCKILDPVPQWKPSEISIMKSEINEKFQQIAEKPDTAN